MESVNSFGIRLKEAIKASIYTQKELSEIIRISQDTLTNYIKGKTKPKADVISRISAVLKVSSDWLLTGNEDQLQNTNKDIEKENMNKHVECSKIKLKQIEVTMEEETIILMYRELTQKDQTEINILLEAKYCYVDGLKKKKRVSPCGYEKEAPDSKAHT